MKNIIFSSGIRDTKGSFAILIIRLAFGIMMLTHGIPKLVNFADYAPNFMNFMGLSSSISLGLTIFAEVFCSIFLILGLAVRLSVIPLIVTMLVAVFIAHGSDPFGRKEKALLYLSGYIAVFIVGAGRYSIDSLIKK